MKKNKKILLQLYKRMKVMGVTQKELGNIIGKSQVTISQRLNCHYNESGQFTDEQKLAICRRLQVSPKQMEQLFEEYEL